MPNTAATYPSSASGWTNSGNVTAADSAYAEATYLAFNEPPWQYESTADLVCSSYSFSGVSSGDTITGIVVEISAYRASVPNIPVALKVRVNSSASLSDSVSTGGGNYTYGNSTYIWGLSLTGADLSSLSVTAWGEPSGETAGTSTVFVDYVRVTVYYSDATPDAFSFTDVTDQPLNTVTASNTVTLTGLSGTANVTLSGTGSGEWRKNGGSWTSTAGTVVNGDSVQVRHTTANAFSTSNNSTLTIGSASDTYTTTTAAADTTPDAFSFGASYGNEPSATVSSGGITVSGINSPANVSITNGAYLKNSDGWTSAPGTCVNGDTFYVYGTASASFDGSDTVTLTIGGVNGTFTIYTRSADVTPNAFAFTDVSGVAASSLQTSNTVTITGIEAACTVTFSTSGGTSHQYSKNGGAWTNVATTTASNNDTFAVRLTAPSGAGASGNITLTAGGVADTYSATVTSGDSTPDAFTFTDTSVAQSVVGTSNLITIAGIDIAANVSFSTSGGTSHQYSKNGGAWTAVGATTVVNGDTLRVRLTAPATVAATGNVTMTVGGVSDTFTVTAEAPDSVPDSFSFADAAGVDTNTVTASNTITISGINTAADVSISGGEYSLNGGAWTSASGSVANGNTLQVRLTSAPTRATTVSSTLNVGGVSDNFSVTTSSPDAASQYVVTFRETVYGSDV